MEIDGYAKDFSSPKVFISDDLVVEILSRAGQKTVIRCKSVCKNWQDLITRFVIARLKTLPPLVSGFYYAQKEYKFTTDADLITTDADLKFLECPHEVGLMDMSVDTGLSFLRRSSIVAVSSHQGYVLCAEDPGKPEKQYGFLDAYQFRYIICNPLTRQWVELPKPCHPHYIDRVHLFCYNQKGCNEFKVVSFVPARVNNDFYVEMYTSETGKWNSSRVPFNEILKGYSFLLNGSVYFSTTKNNIYAYDLMEEHMRCLELPLQVSWGYKLLGVSAGSIYYALDDRESFKVWVLDDINGWSLQHEIDYGIVHKQLPGRYDITYRSETEKYYGFSFEPLAFHPLNPNVIFVNVAKHGMYNRDMAILYHRDSERVQVIGDLKHCNTTTVIPYSLPAWVPSLNIITLI
ncbi:hypothetical protein ACHQM5_015250 [Ranunculus cassubicifolius]